jgi:hypothetical protein
VFNAGHPRSQQQQQQQQHQQEPNQARHGAVHHQFWKLKAGGRRLQQLRSAALTQRN